MTSPSPLTFFASPDRLPVEAVLKRHRAISALPAVSPLLESFPEPAAIIDEHRQVVQGNARLEHFSGRSQQELIGMRLGELLGCEHGREAPSGCGTTPACALCGAAAAIAHTQATGQADTRECRITIERSDADRDCLNLQVWTTPIELAGEPVIVVALRDTSGEQRRQVLERMFFHDVLNLAGALRNLLDLWPLLSPAEASEMAQQVSPLAAQLVEEICAQRDLAAAERGDLVPRPELVAPGQVLEGLATLYRGHAVAEGKIITVAVEPGVLRLKSDARLLNRVLGNLLKNALEASARGETVTLSYREGRDARFEVHNQSVMPEAVRLQIFQRSFSTKGGTGRGIGTYSARLLATRYLGGRLTFTSAAGAGTTFAVTLPLQPEDLASPQVPFIS
jgi:signal transduction histidine kinase